jgi:uncharacterized membrane protein
MQLQDFSRFIALFLVLGCTVALAQTKQEHVHHMGQSVMPFDLAKTTHILIMCLDFATIYIFTGALRVAIGFVIVSNIYTTASYLLHERLWARLKWGIDEKT